MVSVLKAVVAGNIFYVEISLTPWSGGLLEMITHFDFQRTVHRDTFL